MPHQPIYYPEDRLPIRKLIPMGIQHVVAMFGATVLAPILMGFNPQVAVFFSGIGTLLFLAFTRFKVPSYLGSSFAFIGPVLAVTAGAPDRISEALFGIAGAAVLYALAGAATIRWGAGWIDRLMPPLVTGTVVAIIGLNLSASSIANMVNGTFTISTTGDLKNLAIALVTFFTAALVSIFLRGFVRLLPILIGVVTGYLTAAVLGMLDPSALAAIGSAAWIGLPQFQTPSVSWHALLVIAPVFVVLVAENKGHISAISGFMGRDLNPHLGRAFLGDAVATFVSAMGGGTPQTTYAENMGVMAITKVFAIGNFVVASIVAILMGLCPKFGAVIQSIPNPVLGGVTLILYGMIVLMGVKIWVDAKVDFADHRNLVVAGASLIVASGLGTRGLTVYGLNLAGIALGTLLAVVLYLALHFKQDPGEASPQPEH